MARDDCENIPDDVHEVLANITFSPEAARAEPGGVDIQFHIHNVDFQAVTNAMVLCAKKVIEDALMQGAFSAIPEVIGRTLAEQAAEGYLHSIVANVARIGNIAELHVPDDVSSLLPDSDT